MNLNVDRNSYNSGAINVSSDNWKTEVKSKYEEGLKELDTNKNYKIKIKLAGKETIDKNNPEVKYHNVTEGVFYLKSTNKTEFCSKNIDQLNNKLGQLSKNEVSKFRITIKEKKGIVGTVSEKIKKSFKSAIKALQNFKTTTTGNTSQETIKDSMIGKTAEQICESFQSGINIGKDITQDTLPTSGSNVKASGVLKLDAYQKHCNCKEKGDTDKSEIGNRGMMVTEIGTVFRDSMGSAASKEAKEGRVNDATALGVREDGTIFAVIADGSGTSAGAIKVASAVVEGAVQMLNNEGFDDCKTAEECQMKGIIMLSGTVNPKDNSLFGDMSKPGKEGEVLKDSGATTAIVYQIKETESGFEAAGVGVGDCGAFTVTSKGSEPLYVYGDLSNPKAVTDPGAQIGSEQTTSGIGGFNKTSDTGSGAKTDALSAVQGFHKIINEPSFVISFSDGFMDNVNGADAAAVIHYLVMSPAFDTVPDMRPPNIFNPAQENRELKINETALNDRFNSKHYSLNRNGEALPEKPTKDMLVKDFGKLPEELELPTEEQAATRLKNYVAWIQKGMEENEKFFTPSEITKNALALVNCGSEIKTALFNKLEQVIKENPLNEGEEQTLENISKTYLETLLGKLSPDPSDLPNRCTLNDVNQFRLSMKAFLASKTKLSNFIETMKPQPSSRPDNKTFEDRINDPEVRTSLNLLLLLEADGNGATGKNDDLTLQVTLLKKKQL